MIKKILGSIVGQLFIVLMGLAIMSACSIGINAGTPEPEPQQALDKSVWQLTAIEGKALPGKFCGASVEVKDQRIAQFETAGLANRARA